MKFILPMPPSINATYGVSGGRYAATRFYKKEVATSWEAKAGWELKTQITKQGYRRKLPLLGDLRIIITFYYSRNRDWDGGLKIVCDLLQRIGVYKDDMQIVEGSVKKISEPGDPRVEIEVLQIK